MSEPFECWGIVEIMGHVKLAGKLSEQIVAGSAFLRVDVPDVDSQKGFTRLFGTGSIYSITPMDEELVRAMAMSLRVAPLNVYDLPTKFRQQYLLHVEANEY